MWLLTLHALHHWWPWIRQRPILVATDAVLRCLRVWTWICCPDPLWHAARFLSWRFAVDCLFLQNLLIYSWSLYDTGLFGLFLTQHFFAVINGRLLIADKWKNCPLFQSRCCFYMPTAHRPRCSRKVADVKPSTQLRMAIPGAKVEWAEWARKLQWEEWPIPKVAKLLPSELLPIKKNHYGQTCPCRNLGASFV